MNEPRLLTTEYAVEADAFAIQALWEKYSKDALYKTRLNAQTWEQDNRGYCLTIGYFRDFPIVICLWWHIINGHRIMFYEATSMIVDWGMIEKWLEDNCPIYKERHCDANNFGSVLSFIREKNNENVLSRS